jgi:hypothetical protein
MVFQNSNYAMCPLARWWPQYDQRRLCSGSAPPPALQIEKEDKRGTLQVSSPTHVTLLRVAVIADHPYIYNLN